MRPCGRPPKNAVSLLIVFHSVCVLSRGALTTRDRDSVLAFVAAFAVPVSPAHTRFADATVPSAMDIFEIVTAEKNSNKS